MYHPFATPRFVDVGSGGVYYSGVSQMEEFHLKDEYGGDRLRQQSNFTAVSTQWF